MVQTYYPRFPLNTEGLATVPFNLECPRVVFNKTGTRILIVTDRPSRTDCEMGRLGDSNPGITLNNVIMAAQRDSEGTLSEFLFVNLIDAIIRNSDNPQLIYARFAARIVDIVERYKPDIIISLGRTFNKVLGWTDQRENLLNMGRIRPGYLNGKEYQCIESFPWLDWAGGGVDSNLSFSNACLLSLVVSHFSLAIVGKNRYTLPQVAPNVHMIGSMDHWQQFYRLLVRSPEPCMDTETVNLNRIDNKLLTAQFCLNGRDCFVLPWQHRESPWSDNDLTIIRNDLYEYFANGKSRWHIYHNAKFDLTQFMVQLKIPFYGHNLWDTASGERELDENLKFWQEYDGKFWETLWRPGKLGVYSLVRLEHYYGLTRPEGLIAKEERGNMANQPLSRIGPYGCLTGDTLIPTENGILRIDEIAGKGPLSSKPHAIDLNIIGNLGVVHATTWIYSGYKPVIKVNTEWGHEFKITKEHLVKTLNGLIIEDKSIDKLKIGDLLCVNPNSLTRKTPLFIKLPPPDVGFKPLKGGSNRKELIKPKFMTPDLAYFMALVVSEGCFTNDGVAFYNSNEVLLKAFDDAAKSVFGFDINTCYYPREKIGDLSRILGKDVVIKTNNYQAVINSITLKEWLQFLGIADVDSYYKTVPWSILQSDEASQLAYLAGYIEGDGCITKEASQITFCSRSIDNLRKLQILLNSHGINSKLSEKNYELFLGRYNSLKLYNKIKPYLLVKIINFEKRLKNNGSHYGVPARKVAEFLNNRFVRWITNFGAILLDDNGNEIIIKSYGKITNILRNRSDKGALLYNSYKEGKYNSILSIIKQLSICTYNNMIEIFNSEYYFVPVSKMEKFGKAHTYDLSVGRKYRPYFVANCLIVHNSWDVYTPWHISHFQQREAKRRGSLYNNYITCVTNTVSDAIHTFTDMEQAGILVDKKYLETMIAPDSIFNKEIKAIDLSFQESPAARQANSTLLANNDIPQLDLLGNLAVWKFSITRPGHRSLLFFDILNLEPAGVSAKTGKPQTDDKFKQKHMKVPEVKRYALHSHYRHLFDTFIMGIWKRLLSNPDVKLDGRLRAVFNLLHIITGRTSCWNPNYQQIPTRSRTFDDVEPKLAKWIKRQFIATFGKILLKADLSAHEVRCWGNCSSDPKIIEVFYIAWEARRKFRLARTAQEIEFYTKELATKGDIHIQNVKFFFNKDVDKKHELRQSIKAVVFGVIYDLTANSLAVRLNIAKAAAQKLIDTLFGRWHVGAKYLQDVKDFARDRLRVISPLARVRHLAGYLHWNEVLHGAMDRRGPNSVIQGMASDLGYKAARELRKSIWKIFRGMGTLLQTKQINAVHDSGLHEVPIEEVPLMAYLVEHAMTTQLQKNCREVHGFVNKIPYDMEIEMGGSEGTMHEFNLRWENLPKIVEDIIDWQIKELGYNLDKIRLLAVVRHNINIIAPIRLRELELSKVGTPPEYCHIVAHPECLNNYIFSLQQCQQVPQPHPQRLAA
jgi:intein/homing endonuclease